MESILLVEKRLRLDIAHDDHLLRNADHVGPSVPGRLPRGFAWVGERLGQRSRAEPSAEESALAQDLEPLRRVARALDPSLARTYGQLRAARGAFSTGSSEPRLARPGSALRWLEVRFPCEADSSRLR